jgi:hypothetical protein
LSNFDFNMHGAHVALVGKHQGGPANQYTTLVTKSLNPGVFDLDGATEEVKKQLTQIQVNLSMEEFLRKFFDMWSSDAELLTSILGFETEHEAWLKDNPDSDWNYQDWLAERVSNFTVMKSLSEKEPVTLSGDQYVDIMKSQQIFEAGTSAVVTVSKAKFDSVSAELELVKKSRDEVITELAEVRKSLEAASTELTATKAELQVMKEAEVDRAVQVRKAKLSKVIAADNVETVLKSLEALDDAAFDIILKQFEVKQTIETEDLSEQGVDVDLDDIPDTQPVATVYKSRVADKIRSKFPQAQPA